MANAKALLTSPRLILCDLTNYLGVQATDEPIGERKSFKYVASFLVQLLSLYIPQLLEHKNLKDKEGRIPVEFYALSFVRGIF